MGSRANARTQKSVSLPLEKISLPVKMDQKKAGEEAVFCVRADASYMVEFAAAIPFFAGVFAVFLFFFQALIVQQEVGNALLATGRELSVLTCETKEETAAYLIAQTAFQKELKKDSAAERFVKGGKNGISLAKSDFSGDFIRLKMDYILPLPFGLFGKWELSVTQRLTCRKWTGNADGAGTDDAIVYITRSGSVYHRKKSCSYLAPSVRGIRDTRIFKERNASGEKYKPCEKCMKNGSAGSGTVYITDYGNRFHSSRVCSKIRRDIFCVRLSEAGGRRACHKCGKE